MARKEKALKKRSDYGFIKSKTKKICLLLLIGCADDKFEINCNSPLFEALIRLNKEMFVIIIWITSQKDYKSFLNRITCYLIDNDIKCFISMNLVITKLSIFKNDYLIYDAL